MGATGCWRCNGKRRSCKYVAVRSRIIWGDRDEKAIGTQGLNLDLESLGKDVEVEGGVSVSRVLLADGENEGIVVEDRKGSMIHLPESLWDVATEARAESVSGLTERVSLRGSTEGGKLGPLQSLAEFFRNGGRV